MSNLTGIPSQCFRGGNLGIFQLMDEESVVKYYQVSAVLRCTHLDRQAEVLARMLV
jgi:hypothetical protein